MQNSNAGQDGLSQSRQAEGRAVGTDSLLEQAVSDYLEWMITSGYSENGLKAYEQILASFLSFVRSRRIAWDEIFTWKTLGAFQAKNPSTQKHTVIKRLSGYLFEQKRIGKPIKGQYYKLPEIYEQYVSYYEKAGQGRSEKIVSIKRVLFAFNNYLERSNVKLSRINIEQVDAFWAEFNRCFAQSTCRLYRCYLRGFLSYLYHERRILTRDLAPLLVGAPVFAHAKPPRFLRPQELKTLFDNLGQNLSSAADLRTYAMLHLAYTLGLRPREISLISLDDICFTKQELSIKDRKGHNPIKLPLPEETLKAIAAYIVGGKLKSKYRTLFLNLTAPCVPITPGSVSRCIGEYMRKLNLPSTSYWLRHTYAQNLLEAGMSIYEIKEMLGHDHIESTRKYLTIHIKLMREVLFDETI